MKCKFCGAEISTIVTSIFNHDGTDSDHVIPFTEAENDAVFFDVDMNWTGYELSEEEQREDIRCPECDKYPFRSDEIQNYDLCRVVCFGRSENSDHDDDDLLDDEVWYVEHQELVEALRFEGYEEEDD